MKRLRYVLLVVLVLGALVSQSPLQAQGDTATFTSLNGRLSFTYPSQWVVQENPDMILVGNAPNTLEWLDFLRDMEVEEGQALVVVTSPDALAESFLFDPTTMTLDELGERIGTLYLNPGDTLQERTIGGYQALYGESPEGFIGFDTAFYIMELEEYTYAMVLLLTPPEELDNGLPALELIASSISYTSVEERSANVTTVWEWLEPLWNVDIEDMLASEDVVYWVDGIAVTQDDMIYVLDSGFGIHVVDPESGERTSLITLDPQLPAVDRFALQADGTIWGIDAYNQLGHFRADGTLIQSFDLESIGIGEINHATIDLLVGPDGNLYVPNSSQLGDGTSLGQMYVLSPQGQVLRSWMLGTDPYIFTIAYDFGPDGNLYVISSSGGTGVTVYDTQGNALQTELGREFLAGGFALIGALTVADDGTIYVARSDGPIYHMASNGTLINTFGRSYYSTYSPGEEGEEPPKPEPDQFFAILNMDTLSNGDLIVGESSLEWWRIHRLHFE